MRGGDGRRGCEPPLPLLLLLLLPLLLGAAGTARAGPLAEIDRLQRQASRLAAEEQALASQVAELDRQLGEATAKLEQQAEQLGSLKERLRRHLLALERLGRTGSLSLLVLAPTLGDLHRRATLLRQALRQERVLLRRAAHSQRTLGEARDRAERVRQELAEVLEQRRQAREGLERELRSRLELMASLRRDAALAAATGRELDDSAAELRKLVDSRAHTGDRWPPIASRKGRLPLPAKGKLVLNFGMPRDPWLGAEVRHLGVDLQAPVGEPVSSLHPGAVVYAGSLPGYGELILVSHGQGHHTVYAQLQRLAVAEGDLVEAGTRLGEVGLDPLGGPAHLHFEIRERGQAQDPRAWLGRW